MTQWKQEILSSRRARFAPITIPHPITIREIVSIALIGFMAGASYFVDLPLLLFPEFGALSNCVITRPQHIWARSPYHLAVMPTLTGCIGVLAAQLLGYGVLSVLLVLIPSLIILNFLRSPILPALSSGLIHLYQPPWGLTLYFSFKFSKVFWGVALFYKKWPRYLRKLFIKSSLKLPQKFL